MAKYDTLVIGDFHIPDTNFRNLSYDSWLNRMFNTVFYNISKIIEKHKIKKLVLAGDIFDAPPKDRGLHLFSTFMNTIPKDIEIVAISGNHEVISGLSRRYYYLDVMSSFFKDTWNIRVESFKEEWGGDILYASHEHIHKLERLRKKYKVVYSHFRSGLGKLVADEIDITPLSETAELVVTGDIHKRLHYDNILYTGSPIDTHFSSHSYEDDHIPSVLLFNEETLEWKWEDTLTDTYRKRKIVVGNVRDFQEQIEELAKAARDNCNFCKIVIQDKKHNLKKLNISEYSDFAIFDLVRTDLEIEKQNKEIVSKITENLSKNNINENLLQFILTNNQHPEWIDSIKAVYSSYEKVVQ